MSTNGLKRYTDGINNRMFKPGTEPEGWWPGVSESYRKSNSESHKGQKAWNEGLTKDTDERVARYSHPKSEEGRLNISNGIKNAWADETYRNNHMESMSTPEYKKAVTSGKKGYIYEGFRFHSAPELVFYIFCKDHNQSISRDVDPIPYYVGEKLHHYIPDFILNGEIIEIKGDWLLDDENNLIDPFNRNSTDLDLRTLAKSKCIVDNNIKIIRESEMGEYMSYIELEYGKDYIAQFKVK